MNKTAEIASTWKCFIRAGHGESHLLCGTDDPILKNKTGLCGFSYLGPLPVVISAMQDEINVLELEIKRMRQRLFNTRAGLNARGHSTACTIWGDDGQGGTEEKFEQPLPCNCGYLNMALASRVNKAESEVSRLTSLITRMGESLDDQAARKHELENCKALLKEWLDDMMHFEPPREPGDGSYLGSKMHRVTAALQGVEI